MLTLLRKLNHVAVEGFVLDYDKGIVSRIFDMLIHNLDYSKINSLFNVIIGIR